MRAVFLMVALLVTLGCGTTPNDYESRIDLLGHQLRCPVCRGVPIAESPAQLATEMMQIVREQVAAGKNDEEIVNYFVERYGEWVLLKPKAEGVNLLIWILPLLFLFGGGGLIFYRFKEKK
jgi:cytochrome c-type biogenesis protein CcmH